MCWNWGQQKTWGVSIPPHGSVRNVKSCRNICLFTSGLSQFSPSPPCQSNVGFLIRNRPSKEPTRPTVLGRGCFETDVGGFSTRSLANSDVVHVLQPAFMSVRALFEGQSAARLARPRVSKHPGPFPAVQAMKSIRGRPTATCDPRPSFGQLAHECPFSGA